MRRRAGIQPIHAAKQAADGDTDGFRGWLHLFAGTLPRRRTRGRGTDHCPHLDITANPLSDNDNIHTTPTETRTYGKFLFHYI